MERWVKKMNKYNSFVHRVIQEMMPRSCKMSLKAPRVCIQNSITGH